MVARSAFKRVLHGVGRAVKTVLMKEAHDCLGAGRNRSIPIDSNTELLERDDARVSVFDSGYVLGDGVGESAGF